MGVEPRAQRAGANPQKANAAGEAGRRLKKLGDVLLSHDLTIEVPSALQGLTTVFGMGTGVPPALSPPKLSANERIRMAIT